MSSGRLLVWKQAAAGSAMADEIGCGWHYTLLGRNVSSGSMQTWVEFVAEADLKRSNQV